MAGRSVGRLLLLLDVGVMEMFWVFAGAAGEEKMLLVSKEKLLVLAGDYCGWRRERVASMASFS